MKYSPRTKDIFYRLPWSPLLQQPIQSSGGSGGSGTASPYAREFQLLQERKRLSTWGITCYELHKPSGKLVFPCFNDLYQCLDTGYNVSVTIRIKLSENVILDCNVNVIQLFIVGFSIDSLDCCFPRSYAPARNGRLWILKFVHRTPT